MFCDHCGARIDGPANFCPGCGRQFGAAAAPPPPMRNRVATHVRTLGILWLVRAGLRLVTGLFLSSFFSSNWWYLNGGMGMPHFVPGLLRGVGFILLAGAIAGALAGWGLLERRPWARTLAMVIGVLALFDFPIGTALGIYTLWVLAPATSEMEYRAMAGPA